MRLALALAAFVAVLPAVSPRPWSVPEGPGAADLAALERCAELEELGPAGRSRLLERLVDRDEPRLAPYAAMFLDLGAADRLHEERCPKFHLSELPSVETGSIHGVLCGLAVRGPGYSDVLVEQGCWRQGFPAEDRFLDAVGRDDAPAKYAALAVLYRVRAVRPVVDVVRALAEAPVDRLPWLDAVAKRVREETSWAALKDGVAAGDRWSLGACLARRHPEAVDVLIRGLSDLARGKSRTEEVWVLGRLGDGRIVPLLVRELLHGCEGPAVEAVHALVRLRDPRGLPALREVALWEGCWRQGSAIWGLGEIGGQEDLSLLEHLGGDARSRAASVAQDAFEKLAARLSPTVR